MTQDSDQPKQDPPASTDDASSLAVRVEGRLDEFAQRFDRSDWIELLAAVLLSLATIMAAWSAYQSTRWGGEEANSYSEAAALRVSAEEATTISEAGLEIDAEMLTTWITLVAEDRDQAADQISRRFRDEFDPAFEAWLALAPAGQIPAGTPFDRPEYEAYAGAEAREAAEYGRQADEATARARRANQTGDDFVLAAVLMATVLFFAGVGTKLKGRPLRVVMIVAASALFIGGLAFIFSLPQSFAL